MGRQDLFQRHIRFEDIGAEEWDDLVSRSGYASVFQTHGWLTSWWASFSQPSWEPLLLTVREGSRVVGLAPLFAAPHPTRRKWRVIRFVGDEHTDYASVLIDRRRTDLAPAFADELQRLSTRRQRVELLEMREADPVASLLVQASRHRSSRVEVVRRTVCPRLPLTADVIARVLRKDSLTRHAARLRRRGAVTVEHLTEASTIQPLLEPYFRQHVERRSVTPWPSLFLRAQNQDFYRRVVATLAPRGCLVFTVVRLDMVPVAFHLGFDSYGEFYWYKPSFDIRLANLSPGEVLLRELFVLAAARGCTAFDFLRGDEPFKTRFASERPRNVSVVVLGSALERTVRRAASYGVGWTRGAARRWGIERVVPPAPEGPMVGGPLTRVAAAGSRLVAALTARTASWCYSYDRIDVYASAAVPAESGQMGPEIVEADLDTLLREPIFASDEQRSHLLRQAFPRLRLRDRCYLVLRAGRLAAWCWVSTRPASATASGLTVPMEAGDAVVYDLVVFREAGSEGPWLLEALLRRIAASGGGTRHWILVKSRRGRLRSTLERAGFSYAFPLRRRVLCGRTVSTTEAPPVGYIRPLSSTAGNA